MKSIRNMCSNIAWICKPYKKYGLYLLLSIVIMGLYSPIEDFLYNFQQIAGLCGMEYEEPIYTLGCAYIPGVSPDFVKDRVIKDCKAHAEKLSERLKGF